jgi:hypothetical protein
MAGGPGVSGSQQQRPYPVPKRPNAIVLSTPRNRPSPAVRAKNQTPNRLAAAAAQRKPSTGLQFEASYLRR